MTKMRLVLAAAVVLQSFGVPALQAAAGAARLAPAAASGSSSLAAAATAGPAWTFGALAGGPAAAFSLVPAAGLQAPPSPLAAPAAAAGAAPVPAVVGAAPVPAAAFQPARETSSLPPSASAAAGLAERTALSANSAAAREDASERRDPAFARARWDSFWHGSRAGTAENPAVLGAVGAAASRARLSGRAPARGNASKRRLPAPLHGAVFAAAALSLPSWISSSLAAVSPVSALVGLLGAAYLASRAARSGAGWLAERFGWGEDAALRIKSFAGTVATVSTLLLPAQLPAVWLLAAPYASGGGFLIGALGADKLVSRAVAALAGGLGWSGKTRALVETAARLLVWGAGGALGLEAAGYSVVAIGSALIGMAAPYMSAAKTLLGTYAAGRLARWGVDRFAGKAGWRPNTRVVVRLVVGIVVWTSGLALGLAASGVSTLALMTTFGVGGIAVTMAAKDFIGNFIEGLKILLSRPFVVGDKIRLGDKDYLVKDMGLRYLELEKAPGETTLMTYAQLAEKAVTIHREYAGRRARAAGKPRVTLLDVLRMASPAARPDSMKRAAAWTAVGLGLAVGLPALVAALGLPWLSASLPYLQGGAALWATRSVSRWLTVLVARLAELAGWDKQVAAVFKLAAQAAACLVGGTVALRVLGVDWSALLGSLGATSIAVGWASADIVGDVIQGFWILMSQPFRIGDALEIGSVQGAVVDMNMQYVVLEHADKSHTLVPYSVIKASAFTVLRK